METTGPLPNRNPRRDTEEQRLLDGERRLRNRSTGTSTSVKQNGSEAHKPKSGSIESGRRAMGDAIPRWQQSSRREGEEHEEFSDPGEDDGDGDSQEAVRETRKDSKASLDRAVILAGKPKELRKAKETFVKRFLAANTLAAKNSKRGRVMEIAKAAGCGKVFPLTRDIITLVGTALDEAKIQSGTSTSTS